MSVSAEGLIPLEPVVIDRLFQFYIKNQNVGKKESIEDSRGMKH